MNDEGFTFPFTGTELQPCSINNATFAAVLKLAATLPRLGKLL